MILFSLIFKMLEFRYFDIFYDLNTRERTDPRSVSAASVNMGVRVIICYETTFCKYQSRLCTVKQKLIENEMYDIAGVYKMFFFFV